LHVFLTLEKFLATFDWALSEINAVENVQDFACRRPTPCGFAMRIRSAARVFAGATAPPTKESMISSRTDCDFLFVSA
jgi:hypothetical protein